MDLNEPFNGACANCALSCCTSHGAGFRDGPRHHLRAPCFTKLVDDSSVEGGPSCWMKVPETFVAKYLPHVNQERMVLENRDGARWPVMYTAECGFQSGWGEFSTANELAVGDTLFFLLVDDTKFVVHVFGKSCCEKRLTMPTRSTLMPSSSTRQRRESVPDDVGRAPTPIPAYKSVSRLRPDEPGMDIERELRFGREREGGGSLGALCAVPHISDDDDNAATRRNHQQRKRRNSKDGTPNTRKSQPPASSRNNLSNIETRVARRRSLPNLKVQSDSGYLRGKRMPMPKWGKTLAQLRARAAVEKAKLTKMNGLTDLRASEHREFSFRRNQNPLKRKNVSVEATNIPIVAKMSSRRHGGSCSHQQDSVDIPQLASPRTPGRLGTGPLAEQRRVPFSGFKLKRGRPYKHQHQPDSQQRPAQDIFQSQRRPVTDLEKDEALTAANSFAAYINASHINPTTFILVMRPSFVYRNFVLGLSRKFRHTHMPPCSKEVTLVDSAWRAWFCSWNYTYCYITGRGWRNFALEHCIEEDDVLLFHILSETDTMLTIQVHIFRVVAIPDDLTGWESHICPKNAAPELHSGATIMQPIEPHVERPKQSSRHQSSHYQSSRYHRSAKEVKRETAVDFSATSEELSD